MPPSCTPCEARRQAYHQAYILMHLKAPLVDRGTFECIGRAIVRETGGGHAIRAVVQQVLKAVPLLDADDGPTRMIRSKLCARMDLSMTRESFGRAAWLFMHATAAHAPPALTRALVVTMSEVYPCPECRAHFAAYVAANPPPVEGIDAWLTTFHDVVNRRLGKPVLTLSRFQLKSMYAPA